MRMRVVVAVCIFAFLAFSAAAGDKEEAFWEAARVGDLETIKRLHSEGLDVNVATEYGATALAYASDKGHIEIVRYLLDNGADVNAEDTFYQFNPLGWALFNERTEIVTLLLEKGAEGADQVLTTGVRNNNKGLVEAALKTGQINSDHVAAAMTLAKSVAGSEEIVALLEGAEVTQVERAEVEVDLETLESYTGRFKNDDIGLTLEVRLEEGTLIAQATGQPPLTMRALSEEKFQAVEFPQINVSFAGRGGMIERAVVEQAGQTFVFPRITETADAAEAADASPAAESAGSEAADAEPAQEATPAVAGIERRPAQNWPSFRGVQASGNADGQAAPVEWDAPSGKNVRWKTPIPGLANSSPIVWGDRIFVTTAVSGAGDDTFRTGLYGDVDSVDDESEHAFKTYALDRESGKILWEQTASRAVPGAKRHMKSTQANSTPVTDGKRVVALFGTIGMLVCYDMKGKELWRTDVGVLDAGWFYDRSYQWGHASSPVIYKDLVIVQADIWENSFIAAYALSDGKQKWKTPREDIPSWGSPTIYSGGKRDELIANGKTIKGYDPNTGKELWSLSPNSEVTVATPVVAHDLFYVTAGYPPVRPIYAIRPGANGDISLPEDAESSEAIAWSKNRGGTYLPTPIVYGDYLYTCANNGRLTAYDAKSGEEIYRARIGSSGSFTASPIAADGRLYFTTEEGDIYVVKAGPEYEVVSKNSMDEVCMSTPVISDGLMLVRTLNHVYGIGETEQAR